MKCGGEAEVTSVTQVLSMIRKDITAITMMSTRCRNVAA